MTSSLRTPYGRHHDFVNLYGISVSQMTTDMLRLSWSYSHPSSILTSFMTYHWICNMSQSMGARCGAGIAHPSEAPEF